MKRNYLADFTDDMVSRGKYCFTLEQIRGLFNVRDEAMKQALRRLVLKNRIVSIRRNFYVIIPPEYLARRIPPPSFFVDALMKYVGKPYYAGLLSAAAIHGSAHQQAQQFFVVTVAPALRRISVRGTVIQFISAGSISEMFLQKVPTKTGYLSVSCPELTAIDCIRFASRIGGMARAAVVINDIIPHFSVPRIRKVARERFPAAVLQRLGFLIDSYGANAGIGNTLYTALSDRRLQTTPLAPEEPAKKSLPENRWNVAPNIDVTVEE